MHKCKCSLICNVISSINGFITELFICYNEWIVLTLDQVTENGKISLIKRFKPAFIEH